MLPINHGMVDTWLTVVVYFIFYCSKANLRFYSSKHEGFMRTSDGELVSVLVDTESET